MNEQTAVAGTDDPGIGHNQPTPFEERQIRTEELVASVNVWLATCSKIETEAQAGRAKDLRDLIGAAIRVNEKERDGEVRPLNDQVKEINGRYKGLAALLDKSVAALKVLLQPWLDKLEAERIAQVKAEQAEADRLTREAAAKALEATTIQDQVAADEAADAAKKAGQQAAATARSRATVKGEVSGRASGLRGSWRATEITDIDKAFNNYRDHPQVAELLLKLASAAARGGARRIPGFKLDNPKTVA